jgi:hypothetical protein
VSLFALLFKTGRRMHSTGFWVPWTVASSSSPVAPMVQSVD